MATRMQGRGSGSAEAKRARRRVGSPAVLALRLIAYFSAAWGTVIALSDGLFPASQVVLAVWALYTTIPLLAFIKWRGWPFYPGALFRLFVVRPFWYTQLILPVVSAAGLVGAMVGLPFGRAMVVGQILAGIMLVAMGALLVAGYLGSKKLVVRDVEAHVPGLPAEFDGLRIAQLSDLHIGPHTSRCFLDKVLDATRGLSPDLIAITGDLIDDRAEDVAVLARRLGSLEAPLGVYMIPGNHDVYAGWDDVERALNKTDLGTVLVNECALITRGEAQLAIVGTGDPAGGHRGSSRAAPDVELALSDVPMDTTVVAFAHNPALWPALAERGVALTLSGHTHWGQFAIPGLGWSLASPFLELAMGAHVDENALLYISPGTGYWGIPFRLGASPEVTLVTLRSALRASASVHAPRVHRRRFWRKRAA